MKPQTVPALGGQSITVRVGALRGASILLTGVAVAALAPLLVLPLTGNSLADVGTGRWWLAALATLGAAGCAYAEITAGVSGARTQERHLRERILRTYFTSAAEGKTAGGSAPPPARYLALLTDSIERVTEYRQVYWGATVASVIAPLLLVLYIVTLDWVTGLTILALIPLVPLVIWLFFRFFRKVSGNSRAERERLAVSYLDAIRQLTVIRLYGAGQRVEDSLSERGEANRRAVMKLLAANQLVIIVMDAVFLVLLICWAVFVISWRASAGALEPGAAVTALLLLPLLLEPLAQVAGFFYIGMGGRASQRVICRYLATGTLSAGHPGGKPGRHPGGKPAAQGGHQAGQHPGARRPSTTAPQRPVLQSPEHRQAAVAELDLSAALSVRGLGHSYGRGQVFRDLSFDVPAGTRLAIMGPSGVGKSTLINLLAGTLPVQEGAVAVGGQELGSLPASKRQQVAAVVAQRTWLFSGTIADNLRLARSDATDAQLWEALTAAQLADDVRALPQGLATDVGEQGSLLSGGQAQRLSLARAILSGRKVLLMDEPTAHVDPASEERIITALSQLGSDYTLVMVTHRDSLLTLADTLLTLEPGGTTLTRPQEAPRV